MAQLSCHQPGAPLREPPREAGKTRGRGTGTPLLLITGKQWAARGPQRAWKSEHCFPRDLGELSPPFCGAWSCLPLPKETRLGSGLSGRKGQGGHQELLPDSRGGPNRPVGWWGAPSASVRLRLRHSWNTAEHPTLPRGTEGQGGRAGSRRSKAKWLWVRGGGGGVMGHADPSLPLGCRGHPAAAGWSWLERTPAAWAAPAARHDFSRSLPPPPSAPHGGRSREPAPFPALLVSILLRPPQA